MPDPGELPPLTRRDWLDLRDAARRPAARARADIVLLEGRRLVEDALARGGDATPTRAVLDADRLARDERLRDLAARLVAGGVDVAVTAPDRFAKMSGLRTAPGILAVARKPRFELEATLGRPGPILAAVGVQDPANLGALARCALAFSAVALVTTRGGADPFGPRAIRASAGALLALPAFVLEPDAVLATLRAAGRAPWLADAHAERTIEELAPESGAASVALLVGGETGDVDGVVDGDVTRFRIPLDPAVESLNLTAATAIALWVLSREA